MKKISIITLLFAAIACSSPSGNLGKKKAKMKKMQDKMSSLKSDIKDLQEEINKLDTTKHIEAAASVVVSTIEPRTFIHYVEVQGKVSSDNDISISPQANGTVEKIFVGVGDKVRKGQTLIQIDGKIIKKQIAGLQSSLDYATEMYKKQKTLWDQNIGSEAQYLQAKNQKENLENQIATQQQQYDMTTIKSPINGVVDEIDTKIGEIVAPGRPIARVVNLSKYKIVAQVGENYSDKVHKGDKVIITLPNIDKTIKSTITYAGSSIDPVDRTFNVEIALGKVTNVIKPNMLAVLKIADYQNDSALAIPINAIQYREDKSSVILAKKQGDKFIAEKVSIQTGKAYDGKTIVTSGIKAGDIIITFGFEDLKNGEAVQFKEANKKTTKLSER